VNPDILTLTVNGQQYSGWTKVRVSRALEHCASDFDIEVSERWADSSQPLPWQIKPFDSCVLAIDGAPILTGYIDEYLPTYDAKTHTVRVTGRSKTEDLVDCMPDVGNGQFNGYALDQVAKALAVPFGINVLVQASMGSTFPDATHEKSETAFELIAKMCRMRGILAFDDENGNLVLAQAGTASASGALVEGQNIKRATGKLSGAQRFSEYDVLAQAPLAFNNTGAQTRVAGRATDPDVPRFRRYCEIAESPSDPGEAQKRAVWRAKRNYGKGTQTTITVQGWRQPDSSFWKVNQLVPVTSPRLEIARALLTGKISYLLGDETGRETEITLSPPEAFTPEPLSPKPSGSTNSIWSGAKNIQGQTIP
jgi:prophage tail gpP-like protein